MKKIGIVLVSGVLAAAGCGGGGSSGGKIGLLTYGSASPTSDVYISDIHELHVTNESNTNQADLFPDLNTATNRVVWSQFIGPNLCVVSDTIPPSGSPSTLANASQNERFPRYSPDGSKITFTSIRDGHQEVYIMNANGSNQTRLTNNPEGNLFSAFSPDGTKIVFISGRDGNPEVYVMNADGSNQTRLTNTATPEDFPDFTTDGTRIVYRHSNGGSSEEIDSMLASDGSDKQLIRPVDVLSYPSVGSDNRVYFIESISGVRQVCRVELSGGGFKQVTHSALNKIAPKMR